MIDLLAVQNPFTLKLALFLGAFLFAASAALVRPSIVEPLLTSIQNSPGKCPEENLRRLFPASATFDSTGNLVAVS